MPPPHPLRRISTGSLSSLARSTDRAPSSNASGLDFLQPALTDLVDEAATLASNVAQMTALHDALGTFNEAFAGYLYALKMNAFCVEWPKAPNEISFERMPSLADPEPTPPAPPTPTSHSAHTQSRSEQHFVHPADLTYATTYSTSTDDFPPPASKGKSKTASASAAVAGGVRKPATGPAAAANKAAALAKKKKRELEVSGIIDTLPLEYRGGEPAERMRMEKVIMKLMDNPSGIPLKEMVSPPEMPQAKVNKCLITLVSRKLVAKPTVDKVTMYKWVGA